MDTFTVFKRTGTHADVLAAVGAAGLLEALDPQLVSHNDRFEIRLQRAVTAPRLTGSDPGFRYLLRASKKAPKLPLSSVYELARLPGVPLDSDQRMYSIIARLGAEGGLNKLVVQWSRLAECDWARSVWQGLNGREDFVTNPSLVQLFNPQAARGYSLLKPAGTDRGDKSKDCWGEPFFEWLRYRGYFDACTGVFLEKDVRVFTAVPEQISYRLYKSVMAAFRELRWGGSAAKIDCRMVLSLTRILIEQMPVYGSPASFISHLSIAHYRSMGQANALMAMQQCAIPGWLELRNGADAVLWHQILEEHDKALRRLNDSNSDHLAVIQQYRRCLQLDREASIEEFAAFLQDYGMLVFKIRAESERWILPQFSLDTAGAILNAHPRCRSILQNPGFRSIAVTLRYGTLSAQVTRRKGVRNHREVRYGVLSAVKRSATIGPGALIETVRGFVKMLNKEAAHRLKMYGRDSGVTGTELESFVDLAKDAPTGLVGALLCGVAACRRGEEAGESAQAELEQATAV
ncbi:MAG: hypothetical protein WAL45_17970 [Terracidiphilus sp.]